MSSSSVVQRDAFEEVISMPQNDDVHSLSTSATRIEEFKRLEVSSLNDRLLELRDQTRDFDAHSAFENV